MSRGQEKKERKQDWKCTIPFVMTVVIDEAPQCCKGTSLVPANNLHPERERGGRLTPPANAGRWASSPSEPLAGHEDEEGTDGGVDEDRDTEDHDRAASEELADVRLAHPREIERGVLAVAEHGQEGVERVLVR